MSNKPSFAKKHASSGRLFDYEVPEHFEYTDLASLAELNGLDTVYQVNAIYINTKGKHGDQPVIATNNELVNAPQHLMTTVKAIFDDVDSVVSINEKLVGFVIYAYQNKHGDCFGLDWVDIKPEK